MAKCITVPPTPIEPDYQLTLSAAEASALLDVFAHVGGDPVVSRRRHIDSVKDALYHCGARRKNGLRMSDINHTERRDRSPGMSFLNDPEPTGWS